MKTFLTAAILGLTGLAGLTGAEAQDVHKYRGGNDSRHEQRHEPRRDDRGRFHTSFRFGFHTPAPRMERVWVPARFETVIVGYDHCNRPIYNTVCVSAGYWTMRACD
jgi:hypothetical protein